MAGNLHPYHSEGRVVGGREDDGAVNLPEDAAADARLAANNIKGAGKYQK